MTPRKKATELFNKYESTIVLNSWCDENTTEDEINSLIKLCALIAVDEILYVLNEIDSTEQWTASWFYTEVKQEIEKL